MRFAVVGAGAVGAFVGASLARAGEPTGLIARGPHLEAMRRRGVRVRLQSGEEFTAHPDATDNPEDIGPVDVVFLALKAFSIAAIAPRLASLFGPETTIVAAQNGIPWWYFENCNGPMEGTHLDTVDPGGFLSSTIPARRVIGCVIYCSTAIVEPGVVEQTEGNRFAIGEIDGSRSDRCRDIAQAFQNAGLRCAVRSRIRHDIWVKLIGSLALNPISALTGACLDEIVADPGSRSLTRKIMEEGVAVARALGMELDISAEQRLQGAAKAGAHKTSTLQDLEKGRPLELDAIVGAVVELAEKLGVSAPHTKTVFECARLLEKQRMKAGLGCTS